MIIHDEDIYALSFICEAFIEKSKQLMLVGLRLVRMIFFSSFCSSTKHEHTKKKHTKARDQNMNTQNSGNCIIHYSVFEGLQVMMEWMLRCSFNKIFIDLARSSSKADTDSIWQ